MKRLTKIQLKRIHEKCLNLLRRKPPTFFIFRKLKGYYGQCDYEKDVVEIDPRRDIVGTTYHECIHYIYPDWSETQVLYAESRVVNTMPILELIKFLKILSTKLYQNEIRKVKVTSKKKKKKTIYKNNKK
jgi:hypothetical protein